MAAPKTNSNDTAQRTGQRVGQRAALQAADVVQSELEHLRSENAELLARLHDASVSSQTDRDARRAALNLAEDATATRAQLLAVNRQLQARIAERERAETALRTADAQLRSTVDSLQKLNAEFDRRVQERTRDVLDREARLRALTSRLQQVEQRQRHDLARLLHDHVQQFLVAAKMRVEFTADDVGELQGQELRQVVSIIEDAIQATRDLSVQLTPPLLHDQGLPPALDWLIARVSKEHGLSIQTSIDEDANPSSQEVRQVLFQAAQELLLNVVKHAQSSEVVFRLARAASEIRLSVTDRGKGFDPSLEGDSRGSFGLFHLRQRLESIGGRLNLRASPGAGTRATAIVVADGSPDMEERSAAPLTPPALPLTAQISVVLVDDHPVVREGLSQMLSRADGIHVVGQAADGVESIEIVGQTQPDVVVMDVDMPVLNGIEATRRIVAQWPQVKIIGLSFQPAAEMGAVMFAAGAAMYLTKDAAATSLVEAIREVAECRVDHNGRAAAGRERRQTKSDV